MVAGDGAAAHRGKADRAGLALEAGAVAAAFFGARRRRARAAPPRRACSAVPDGRVGLAVVMRLDDLDVPRRGRARARRARPGRRAGPRRARCWRRAARRSVSRGVGDAAARRGRRGRWCRSRIGMPAAIARSRLLPSAAGAEKSTSTSPWSGSMAKPGSAAAASAMARPMRPSGANRVRRMGWRSVRMAGVMAQRLAGRNPEPLLERHARRRARAAWRR